MNANFQKLIAATSLVLLSSGAARANDVSYVASIPLPAGHTQILAYSVTQMDLDHPDFRYMGPSPGAPHSTRVVHISLDTNQLAGPMNYPRPQPQQQLRGFLFASGRSYRPGREPCGRFCGQSRHLLPVVGDK